MLYANPSSVWAEEENNDSVLNYELDKIVVTATKTEKKEKDVPAAVTVITAKEIAEANVRTIDEILQYVPGVYVKPQRGMKGTTISIRGLRQSEILVLMDGLSLNNGSTGGAQWANIPIENIEKIEVIRGSFSALYGSNAMGGVINIITKTDAKPGGSIGLEAGGMNTRKQSVDFNGKAGKLQYYLDYAKRTTDGYITNEAPTAYDKGKFGSDSEQYSFKLVYDMNAKERMMIYSGSADYSYRYDIGTNRGKRVTDYTNISYENKLSDDKKLNIRFGELNYKDYWTITSKNYQPNPTRSRDFDINMNFRINEKNNVVFGIAQKEDKTDSYTYKLSNPAVISYTAADQLERSGGKATTKSIYFQDEIQLANATTLYIGSRYDQWKFHSAYSQVKVTDAVINQPDKEENSFSPKIALVHEFNDKVTGRISAGKSFTAPGLFNLTRLWAIPAGGYLYNNPNLKAETVRSYDLGLDYKVNPKTVIRFSIFQNDMDNMIQQYDIPGTNNIIWDNIGKARAKGVEFEIDHKISPAWNTFLNFTYNDAKVIDFKDKSLNGNTLQTVPRETLNIGLRYNKEKLTANFVGTYISKTYESINNTSKSHLEPNFVMDTKVNYSFDKNNNLAVYVDNLFDRKYYQESLAPGRCVGVEYKYKF
ncbi:Outer membrane vitamin B12 receptor BtuB [Sporomusa ovata]|uniref:Outer membrane vitamin B12 receptor BtuB n=2 Tax=Sporomusa ovata TaxID=2378 RepID=A0A0U1KRT8_9FIRM|nr:Outer membrane vitamin B12 receptor BtuB [Sporomusa ovata]